MKDTLRSVTKVTIEYININYIIPHVILIQRNGLGIIRLAFSCAYDKIKVF